MPLPEKQWTRGFAWLVAKTVFQSISDRLPERGRKRREKIEEKENVQTTLPAPTASVVGPCPTVIQIVGRPGTGSLPRTIAFNNYLNNRVRISHL